MLSISRLIVRTILWVFVSAIVLGFMVNSIISFVIGILFLAVFSRVIFDLNEIVPFIKDILTLIEPSQDKAGIAIKAMGYWLTGYEVKDIRRKLGIYPKYSGTKDYLLDVMGSVPYLEQLTGKAKDLFLLSHMHHDVYVNGLIHFFLNTPEDMLAETFHVLKKHNLFNTVSIFNSLSSHGITPHHKHPLTDKEYNYFALSNLKFHQVGATELQRQISSLYT